MHHESRSHWRYGIWLIVALWLTLWVMRLAVSYDLVERDQQKQSAYIMDVWGNGRWSSQADFRADMASKPPLYNWIGAAAVEVFGPGQLAVTLPAALATLCLASLAYYWTRALWGPRSALLAAVLMLLPMVGPKMVAYVRTDGLFAATVGLTAYAWWRAWERGSSWWWAWIAAIFATLAKGPLGLLLGSLGLLALAWERRWPGKASGQEADPPHGLSGRALLGLPVYLLLVGGWFLWAWSDWGQPLIDRMIHRELVGHAVSSHDAPGGFGSQVWKAPLYFLGRTAPWGFVTVLALLRVFRRPDERPARRRAERFLACWLLGGVLIFSLASHQRGDLIWPVVLPGAILAAPELQRLAQGWPVWTRRWLGPALVVLVLLGHLYYQGIARRSESSLRSRELAQAISQGPGAEFPVSYAVKYATQVPLGLNRYLVSAEQYITALAERPAVYVAVPEPEQTVESVAALGGRARVLIRTQGGWGIVSNREDWSGAVPTRLLMGPVEIVVDDAQWKRLRGRELSLTSLHGQVPVVSIANRGPHREPFVINLQGAAERLRVTVGPGTRMEAVWKAGRGWTRTVVAESGPPVPGDS